MNGLERLDVLNPWWMKVASFGLGSLYFIIAMMLLFGVFCLFYDTKYREKEESLGQWMLEALLALFVTIYVLTASVGQLALASADLDIYGWAIGQKSQDEKVRPLIEDMGNYFVKEYLTPQIEEIRVKVGDVVTFTIMVTKLEPRAYSAKPSQSKTLGGWKVLGTSS